MKAVGRTLLTRTLWGVLVLWLISLAVFASTQLLPGNAAKAILGRNATPEQLAALEEQLNLQGSAVSQYLNWTGDALQLDFGTSLSNRLSVGSFLLLRFENTLILMVAAAAIGIPFSLALGALLASRRSGAPDSVVSVVTLAIAALPEFVIGAILIIVFSTGFTHVLPATSSTQPILSDPGQLVLPALTLALAIAPYIIRMTRATMIEVLESEYVLYARVIGVRESSVMVRHALPNALGAVLQVTALQLAYLAGGVVVVEYVFGFPGLGAALVDAVNNRDLPVLQALCLFIAAFYIVVNLLADAATLALNPRARRPVT